MEGHQQASGGLGGRAGEGKEALCRLPLANAELLSHYSVVKSVRALLHEF